MAREMSFRFGLGRKSTHKNTEYWKGCRDWLNNEKVTPMSPKVPNLSEIQTQYELYNYLKDGTELCRVIGMITEGSIPTDITYRTNNVSNLEEKNVRLFLNLVERNLGIKNVFGKHKEGVFRKYKDFYVVIDGLSEVSKKLLEKKLLSIEGFRKG